MNTGALAGNLGGTPLEPIEALSRASAPGTVSARVGDVASINSNSLNSTSGDGGLVAHGGHGHGHGHTSSHSPHNSHSPHHGISPHQSLHHNPEHTGGFQLAGGAVLSFQETQLKIAENMAKMETEVATINQDMAYFRHVLDFQNSKIEKLTSLLIDLLHNKEVAPIVNSLQLIQSSDPFNVEDAHDSVDDSLPDSVHESVHDVNGLSSLPSSLPSPGVVSGVSLDGNMDPQLHQVAQAAVQAQTKAEGQGKRSRKRAASKLSGTQNAALNSSLGHSHNDVDDGNGIIGTDGNGMGNGMGNGINNGMNSGMNNSMENSMNNNSNNSIGLNSSNGNGNGNGNGNVIGNGNGNGNGAGSSAMTGRMVKHHHHLQNLQSPRGQLAHSHQLHQQQQQQQQQQHQQHQQHPQHPQQLQQQMRHPQHLQPAQIQQAHAAHSHGQLQEHNGQMRQSPQQQDHSAVQAQQDVKRSMSVVDMPLEVVSMDEMGARKKPKIAVDFLHNPMTVKEIYDEYTIGFRGQPPLRDMDERYGKYEWRGDSRSKESKRFQRRKKLCEAVERGMRKFGKTAEEIQEFIEEFRGDKSLTWVMNGNLPRDLME